MGEANLPESVAALASAQAAFMRDVAETLGMARDLLDQQGSSTGPSGTTATD